MSNLLLPLPAVGTVENHGPYMEDHVDTSVSGKETVSTYWLTPRYKYKWKIDALNSLTRLDYQALRAFFVRQQGRLGTFLVVDPEDSVVTDHGFALGDGVTTAFQLQRTVGGAISDAAGVAYNATTKPYTNLVKNSSFETDSNADGLADSWIIYNPESATVPAFATIVPGMNGGKAQRISWGANATAGKGITQQPIGSTPLAGQWYTLSVFARASGTNVGKFLGLNWDVAPSSTVVIACPALSGNWQRYVFRVFWNVGLVPTANVFFTLSNVATGAFSAPNTFGDLDFDLSQVTTGQWGAADLQPVETPAAATGTDNPAFWPAQGDGFEPLYDLNGSPTIYQDGDWRGRRQLYPWARANLLPFSEQFDNAAWAKARAFVTGNAATAPDGNVTADAIAEGNPPGAPTLNTLTPSTTGGTLAAGSYFVKVSALNANSEEGLPSVELSATTTGATGSIAVAWSAPGGGGAATGYRVYVGTATGAEGQFFLPGNVTAFTITTATGTAGTPLTTTATTKLVVENTSPAEVQGELRCYSIFLKPNTLPNIVIRIAITGEGVNANLGTLAIDGAIGGALASGVQTSPLWNGFIRVWFVKRVTATLGTGLTLQPVADNTYNQGGHVGTGRSCFAWGAMCERTSNLNGPTPYIPTPSTTAVTVTDYSVSSTGVVTPTAVLPAGAFLSADMSFYRRVRLANPELSFQRIVNAMYSAGLDLVSTI